ncbi:TIGR02281 family clan AA aspartic protease [Thalassococcus sp. S3]|uniref:retropepsin-like aspartic protease family protein n=1 Tax=Thalassococcus sp. S3 TaxID=2017482 RepID=UPI0010246BD1|nr:TIGR02281 family clan AA aspartic protease [Thalassococcus sp. S3]QBF31630.1 TIGR02281 family clan AA aspartic protease [Thalassococcus sp. S3]
MANVDYAHLTYLLLLGCALAFWYFTANRNSLGKTVQHMAAWFLIFVGVIAAIGLWDDIRQTVRPTQSVFSDQGRVEVPRSPDGHYYLTLDVNGEPVRFVVDTGATDIVLTQRDAARAGISLDDLNYIGRAMTANGTVRTAPVRLDEVALGAVVDRGINAWVNEGEMSESLLGMAYLQRWDRIEISGGELVLQR